MTVSLRKFRALVFEYFEGGAVGVIDSTYLIAPSTAADQAWWAARGLPSGREWTVGTKAEHRIDAVLAFDAACPVDVNGAVKLEPGTAREESFIVRSVLRRDYGRNEVQVLAERVTDLKLTTT